MGYKNVCLDCKRVENLGSTPEVNPPLKTCPICGSRMFYLNYKFRAPKKNDPNGWKVVSLLIRNGFDFSHIYDYIEPGVQREVKAFPNSLRDAEAFVEKYKAQFKGCKTR